MSLSEVFTLDSFADGVAGASGGITAISVFYPLNIIRTKLQTSDPNQKERTISQVIQEILNEDGPSGLFKGWWGQVVALGCSNFIYFYTYQMLKVLVVTRTRAPIGPSLNLSVGAVAGVVNVLLTTPLWMVCRQLAVQSRKGVKEGVTPYAGMIDGLTRCYQSKGLSGLWKGLGPNLMLVSNPTIHFFTYERVRQIFEKMSKKRERETDGTFGGNNYGEDIDVDFENDDGADNWNNAADDGEGDVENGDCEDGSKKKKKKKRKKKE